MTERKCNKTAAVIHISESGEPNCRLLKMGRCSLDGKRCDLTEQTEPARYEGKRRFLG